MNDLHIPCLKCLAICLDDTESLKLIQSTGVFQKLLAFTAESSSPETQHFAASVIAASCKIDENRRIFNEQETEKTLITLLSSDNISVVIAATSALAAMAENLTSREKIGKLDGIPLIIPLLKNDAPEAKDTASLALANLANTNPTNCAVIMEKNTIDILIRLLSDENSETQSNCAICLSNLALNETWRSEIEKHGVIKGLINAIKSTDPKVQIYTCQALAAFVYDHDSRMQVLSEEGIPHLVSLIKSNNESVRRNASWVIVLCAVDGTLAEEITKCGGLDALQEINMSSRKSQFTDIALERLLDSNLSAKYSVTGVLTFDNIIDDLFYDAGKTGQGNTFLTLNELNSQEMNQNRPVILINFRKNKNAKKKNNSNQTKITPDKSLVEKNKNNSKQPPRKQSRAKVITKEREETTKSQELEETLNDAKKVEKPKIVKKLAIFQPPTDDDFILYLTQVKDDVSSIMSTELQIRTLACFVCDKMGGIVIKSELTRFSYELHISELKNEYDSNIIPIGKIKQGIYYHRALLFKVLADTLSLPCSLIRGDYGRSWNEVQICDIDAENGQAILPPKLFVVDLIHQPGDLLPAGSPEAVSYQRI